MKGEKCVSKTVPMAHNSRILSALGMNNDQFPCTGWHEDTELLSHSSCPSVRSGSGTDRGTCPFVRSAPGTDRRVFRPCDRLQELIDGFVGTCQCHYNKAPADVYQPGRKLIMCLSITHTWLRAEASLPARLSLDIQFLIEKSVVTVLLVL